MRHDELAHYGVKGMRWHHKKRLLSQLAKDNSKLKDASDDAKYARMKPGVKKWADERKKTAEKMVNDVYKKRREQMRYPGMSSTIDNAKSTAAITAFRGTTKKYKESLAAKSKEAKAKEAKAIFDDATKKAKNSMSKSSKQTKSQTVEAKKVMKEAFKWPYNNKKTKNKKSNRIKR